VLWLVAVVGANRRRHGISAELFAGVVIGQQFGSAVGIENDFQVVTDFLANRFGLFGIPSLLTTAKVMLEALRWSACFVVRRKSSNAQKMKTNRCTAQANRYGGIAEFGFRCH
jgi:hypothetical protein